jgi:hypothetical protein
MLCGSLDDIEVVQTGPRQVVLGGSHERWIDVEAGHTKRLELSREQFDEATGTTATVEDIHTVTQSGASQGRSLRAPEEIDLGIETPDLMIKPDGERLCPVRALV